MTNRRHSAALLLACLVTCAVCSACDLDLNGFLSGNGLAALGRDEPVLVFLDFDGRDIIPVGPAAYAVPRLDIDGDRAAFAERVRERIAADFAWANVVLLTSETDEQPAGPVLTIVFGGSHATYLGLSAGSNAVVFPDWLCDDPEQFAQSLANAGGHELGHLLGLAHSGDNPFDLMASFTTPWIMCNFDMALIDGPIEMPPVDAPPAARVHTLQIDAYGSMSCGH